MYFSPDDIAKPACRIAISPYIDQVLIYVNRTATNYWVVVSFTVYYFTKLLLTHQQPLNEVDGTNWCHNDDAMWRWIEEIDLHLDR